MYWAVMQILLFFLYRVLLVIDVLRKCRWLSSLQYNETFDTKTFPSQVNRALFYRDSSMKFSPILSYKYGVYIHTNGLFNSISENSLTIEMYIKLCLRLTYIDLWLLEYFQLVYEVWELFVMQFLISGLQISWSWAAAEGNKSLKKR